MVTFGNHIENQEMLECLSVHQTFLCLLHLANENCLKFERHIHEVLEEDDGEELVFRDADIPAVKKGRLRGKGAKAAAAAAAAAKTNILKMMEK